MITRQAILDHINVLTQNSDNDDYKLAILRMKTNDVILKCYLNDGNLRDILQELVATGGKGTDDYTLDECIESLISNYNGNCLSITVEDFFRCEW